MSVRKCLHVQATRMQAPMRACSRKDAPQKCRNTPTTHTHALTHVHTERRYTINMCGVQCMHGAASHHVCSIACSNACGVRCGCVQRRRPCLCAAYAYGPAGSNSCPTNYAKITTKADCQVATNTLSIKTSTGSPVGVFGPIEDANYPAGCYYSPNPIGVKFNDAVPGIARPDTGITPICAGAHCISRPAHAVHPAAAFELA